MSELVVVEFVTLDGVMQGFGGPDEDRRGGFEHGGWGAPYADPAQFASAVEAQRSTAAYLFGRRTYEHMAAFWPHQPDDNPMAAHLNAAPKYVASRTLTEVTWRNASILDTTDGLAAAVGAVKARHDGDIVVLGSGELVAQLVADDLIDGYRLMVHPLLLGAGRRLFPALDRPRRLRLVDVTPTRTGVLVVRYATQR